MTIRPASTGLAGLAAMRPRTALPEPGPGSPAIALLRPLLGWRKADLIAVVAGAGWIAVDDPSNADPRFDHARLRTWLTANEALDPARIATAITSRTRGSVVVAIWSMTTSVMFSDVYFSMKLPPR